jgi:ankyrin repeat protein
LRAFHSIQLISASARGDLRAVDRLLASGADSNVEGDLDYIATPLAMAALCDRLAIGRRLIRAGARVNYRFSYANSQAVREGNTALMWASMGGSLSMVRLLLNRGARADLRDSIYMHGEPPRQAGATALEISMDTDFPTGRAIQGLLRARLRRH